MIKRLTLKAHLLAIGGMFLFTTFMTFVYATYYTDMYAHSKSRAMESIRTKVEADALGEGHELEEHRADIEERIEKEYQAYLKRNASVTQSWGRHFVCDLLFWWPWILLTPGMLLLWHRFQFKRNTVVKAVLVHLPACMAFATAKSAMHQLAVLLIFGIHSTILTMGNVLMGCTSYWIYVAAYNGLAYYKRFREREIRAAQLEKQLVKAQLQVLKMQLHPHFLFNTLHAISTLMARDIRAADRMICRLSDLLRLSLKHIDQQEVSVREELDFLKCYLDIERMRFGDRLVLREEVAADVLDALVPNLILQPIVENAVNHGISRIAATGQITLRMEQRNGTLSIEISDNGPGMASHTIEANARLGLANTKARLSQLYGSRGTIEFAEPEEGGLTVTLNIPFHTKSITQIGSDGSP